MNYMKARDYLQMAGRARATRARQDRLGDLDPRGRGLARRAALALPLGQGRGDTSRFNLSYSTILNLYDRLGSKGLQEAYDSSFAAFQALKGSASARKKNSGSARRAATA